MPDDQFYATLRRGFGWLALSTAAAVALMATLFASGVLPMTSRSGPAMGLLAVLTVVQLACWARCRRIGRDRKDAS